MITIPDVSTSFSSHHQCINVQLPSSISAKHLAILDNSDQQIHNASCKIVICISLASDISCSMRN